MMYFAADGSYGDAQDLLIVSTNDWPDETFEWVEDASDRGRLAIAIQIAVQQGTSHWQVKGSDVKWLPIAQ